MKKYIVVMLLLIIGLGVSAYAMSLAPKIQEGEVATPFVLKDLNGKSVSLASYRGNIVLLNFWASWCPPCRSEMPSIQKLYEKMAQAGVGTVVGMHISEEHKKEAELAHVNIVIAGHISSDSLGVNLFMDELEKQGIEIVPCSGFTRFSRK